MITGNIWVFQAFAAAILWGITYAMAGRVLHSGVSVSTVLILESMFVLPVFLLLAFFKGTIKADFALIVARPTLIIWTLALACSFIAANFFIASSIAAKNATLAALIEITYPLFTFAFTWLIFRESQLNWTTAAGGLLIFAGTALIYLKS